MRNVFQKNVYKTVVATLCATMVITVIAPLSSLVLASTVNLMPNPNVSVATTPGQPDNWYQDSWGNNTASFSYATQGYDDTSALKVTITNYVDGDAKWYVSPVPVTSGTQYTFSDYYMSTSDSNVWARFVAADNSVSFKWLGYALPSSGWQQKAVTFTAPANITLASVFHILNSTGTLTTDSYNLSEYVPAPVPVPTPTPAPCTSQTTNGLSNASFEESCDNGATPANWVESKATNASYVYETNGHSGNKSVSFTASANLTKAEAGVHFAPVQVTPGQRYQYSCWIKSNVGIYAYTEAQDVTGNSAYKSLMSATATGNVWSQYVDSLLIPTGATKLTVYLATDKIGTVQIDDCALVLQPALATNEFNRGMVSITYDDGWRTTYTNGLPVMNQFGYKATYYINYSTLGTSGYMTKTQVKTLLSQGNEIGSHSYEHINLAEATPANVQYQVSQNKTALTQLLNTAMQNFAVPYGAYNTSVLDTIQANNQTNRDTSGMLNHKYNFNSRLIHSWGVDKNTTDQNIIDLINQAKTQNAWLVLVYHDIGNGGTTDTTTVARLNRQLQLVQTSGLPVMTVAQGLQEANSQL